jgi:hypothetical protein
VGEGAGALVRVGAGKVVLGCAAEPAARASPTDVARANARVRTVFIRLR